MKRIPVCMLVAALAVACVASAQPVATPEQQPGLKARYADLNGRIQNTKQYPSKAAYEETTTQLRSMVTDEIMATLARSDDAAKVRKAIADVQGEFAFSSWGPDTTNVPFVEGFQLLGQPGMAAAFVMLRGGSGIPDTLPVLQFYTKESGEWKLRTETDADFHGCTFMVSSVESPVAGRSWWLSWGQTIGDTGARRKVRLYSFDGKELRTVWQRDELSSGNIAVGKDRKTVTIEYYRKEGAPGVPRPPVRVHEEWYVTPNGLDLGSSWVSAE